MLKGSEAMEIGAMRSEAGWKRRDFCVHGFFGRPADDSQGPWHGERDPESDKLSPETYLSEILNEIRELEDRMWRAQCSSLSSATL